jgi:hypothetical protein
MSNVRCRENACSSVRLAFPISSAQGGIQTAAAHSSDSPCEANVSHGWAGPSVRWRPANGRSRTPTSTLWFFWAARPAAVRSPIPPTEGMRLHLTLGARACCAATTPQRGKESHQLRGCAPLRTWRTLLAVWNSYVFHQCNVSCVDQSMINGHLREAASANVRAGPNPSFKRTAPGVPGSAA